MNCVVVFLVCCSSAVEGDRWSSEGRVDLLLSIGDIKKTTIINATIYVEDDDKKDD